MLFMEWLCKFNGGRNPLHKIINDVDSGCFKIRLIATKEYYIEAADYINANV